MARHPLIAGFSARPHPKSKTSAALKAVIASIEQSFGFDSAFFELSEIGASLRASSCRVGIEGPAKEALDTIEQADLLLIGLSVKAPTGYPAMLRYLFEMADPAALRLKPTLLVETHCNVAAVQSVELEANMLLRAFGLQFVADIRFSSRELLQGVEPDDERISNAISALYNLGFPTDHSNTLAF